jgi:hypothetical protein
VQVDAWGKLLNELSRGLAGGELARLAFQWASGGAYLEGKPGQRIDQTVPIKPVDNELTASLAVDQASVFQQRQMARNGGGAHLEAARDLAGSQFLRGKIGENLAPWLGGQSFENQIDGDRVVK